MWLQDNAGSQARNFPPICLLLQGYCGADAACSATDPTFCVCPTTAPDCLNSGTTSARCWVSAGLLLGVCTSHSTAVVPPVLAVGLGLACSEAALLNFPPRLIAVARRS